MIIFHTYPTASSKILVICPNSPLPPVSNPSLSALLSSRDPVTPVNPKHKLHDVGLGHSYGAEEARPQGVRHEVRAGGECGPPAGHRGRHAVEVGRRQQQTARRHEKHSKARPRDRGAQTRHDPAGRRQTDPAGQAGEGAEPEGPRDQDQREAADHHGLRGGPRHPQQPGARQDREGDRAEAARQGPREGGAAAAGQEGLGPTGPSIG